MLPPIPYLDLAGYKRRGKVAPTDVDALEALYPGYVAHRVARGSSWINARLKKRYTVPLGQGAPAIIALGTSPPTVALEGRPTVGSLELVIQITLAGARGVAAFRWSKDGGETWTATGVITAATVVLGTTGLSACFVEDTYAIDNEYRASTPVPEVALGWLAAMLDVDVWDRRGRNPSDPAIVDARADRDTALAEIKEAADAKDGLFDLPTNDVAGDDAVTAGGPLGYSERSPYVGFDIELAEGMADDARGCGR